LQIISNTLELKWQGIPRRAEERNSVPQEEVVGVEGEIVFRLAPGDELDKKRVEAEIANSSGIVPLLSEIDKITEPELVRMMRGLADANRAIVSRMNWAVVKAGVKTGRADNDCHQDLTVKILSIDENDLPEPRDAYMEVPTHYKGGGLLAGL